MLTGEPVTFTDSDGWNWDFDLAFMLSNYACIWGRGCPDIRLQGSARGCCVEGVEIYQGEGDAPGCEDPLAGTGPHPSPRLCAREMTARAPATAAPSTNASAEYATALRALPEPWRRAPETVRSAATT
jgi:hypothetical protein